MIYQLEYAFRKEDADSNAFHMKTRIYESKAITRHISCDFKHKFDGDRENVIQFKSGIEICFNVSVKT